MTQKKICKLIELGLLDFHKVFELQKTILQRRKLREIDNTLILVEHYPVITIGRGGSYKNILASKAFLKRKGICILEVDRGGDVTLHAPGQLIAYPIFDLSSWKKDLHWYLRSLEEVALVFLKSFMLKGHRLKELTGVFVDNKKIAAIGIGASDWVTYHGISININNDLKYFNTINPCGVAHLPITSLAELLKRVVNEEETKRNLIDAFKFVFDLELGFQSKQETFAQLELD
jgi:lipoate-protein ligase B